jgi:1-acyl-sn-glycerol-3-phosphate acyltransferase
MSTVLDATAERLLAVVAQLAAESRGDATPPPVALDSLLDRDLGLDSLARVELILRMERAFDVRLPEALLGEADTPRELLRAVLAGSPRTREALASLPRFRPAAVESGAAMQAATLAEVLERQAGRHPDRDHIVFLGDDGEGAGEHITYAALRDMSHRVAAGLMARGIGAGDAVAIMLPTSRDFFRAFMGIVLAGAVPVPVYPPARAADALAHLRRQSRVLANCGARLLVAPAALTHAGRMLRELVPTLERVVDVAALDAPAAAIARREATDIALLQYTSGSTGDPKGVVLTHTNLLANVRAMGAAAGAGSGDVFVSWLPLYHDMGLIGAWMGAMHYAFPLVVMPPTAFVNRPVRWLRAIHRFRGTMSSAPNFAYEICATRLEAGDLEGLDLSSWRLAFNGAEPVSPATLERFAQRFAAFGFRREALAPVYGLAECAVGLAFPPPGRGPRIDRIERAALSREAQARPAAEGADALRFASCGSPLPGHEIRVVGPDGRELPERSEGRIEFRGPSATRGYFRDEARSRALVRDGWLDTGDVGYFAGGELFVTGRVKDVIIRGGQHVHPYELEEAVGKIAGIRKGCVAVFGVPDAATGSERVVVMAETRVAPGAAREALVGSVREAAVALLGAPPDDIALVVPHAVPKTSSGKIRRAASRDAYLQGPRGGRWRNALATAADLARGIAARIASHAAGDAYAAWTWIVVLVLGSAALGVSLLPAPRLRWHALHGIARAALRACGVPLVVEGLANVPASGAAVIVANHASYLDGPLIFAVLPRPVRFVAKRELAANPLLRLVLGAAGVAFVERFDVERGAEASRELVAMARAGEALVFFPEGTFTRAPGLMPFHMGAFVAAAQSGAPVVPLALRGMRSILRDGHWRPRRGAIGLRVEAPLRSPGTDWADALALRDAARIALLAHSGEPDLARSRAETAV